MSQLNLSSHKHLTLSDRIYIETSLERGLTFKEIAIFLQKDPTTISKEVRKHYTEKNKDKALVKAECIHKSDCQLTDICSNKRGCPHINACSNCKIAICGRYCNKYMPVICSRHKHAPYVCNGCRYFRSCQYNKRHYRAKYAQDMYLESLSVSRRGINLTPEELDEINCIVSPLIRMGQSVAHIYASHKDQIHCSKRTLYSYIDSNLLSVKNIDLRRKVKYKPRRSRKIRELSNAVYRDGRTYIDFENYLVQYPDTNLVEMDTVEGGLSGKVFLTLFFRNCSFMLIFLMERNTQKCVSEVFNMLEKSLGIKVFQKLFPVILTDNGSEFKRPDLLEFNEKGKQRTKLFYCNPYESWQKGRIEKNHEFIRYVIPKGRSFNQYTQEDITLLMNHINSVARASLNDKTPFELAELLLDKKLLKALRLIAIAHDEVLLKPVLLKH
jgi:IS30 family transposase